MCWRRFLNLVKGNLSWDCDPNQFPSLGFRFLTWTKKYIMMTTARGYWPPGFAGLKCYAFSTGHPM